MRFIWIFNVLHLIKPTYPSKLINLILIDK
uniref:Uncharacterized protein n=1 Tax=virus sp. ctmTa7 TaxID=2828255 RepID=A0A8S5RC29_9VIRU|nr:MAG TPA: hypothetical protein [virus sp. ctmTa7]